MDREKKKGLFSFVAFNEKIRGRSRGQRGKLVLPPALNIKKISLFKFIE
jgi:hypothetical protein